MTYHGHVRNGVIVLESPGSLPEGAEATVDIELPPAHDELNAQGTAAPPDPFWGLLAGEPELVDELTAEILSQREHRQLRITDV